MAETLQQTQTLSLRISEALRKRLEDIRKLTALRKGESVSTSEIAKQLLESAREDRFEVVELLNRQSTLRPARNVRGASTLGHSANTAMLPPEGRAPPDSFPGSPPELPRNERLSAAHSLRASCAKLAACSHIGSRNERLQIGQSKRPQVPRLVYRHGVTGEWIARSFRSQ
jgi:hypothetical protein